MPLLNLLGAQLWRGWAKPIADQAVRRPRGAEHLAQLQQQLLFFLHRLHSASQDEDGGGGGGGGGGGTTAAALQRHLGFELRLGPSRIAGAGRGVFLQPGGRCPKGAVLTLYPGLVHSMVRRSSSSDPLDHLPELQVLAAAHSLLIATRIRTPLLPLP